MSISEEKIILHVLVVGFHHKKGCQVEYSFPPLIEGSSPDSNECPSGWKYLPTLALPDGSHNFQEDTVYFHLPSLTDRMKTVYGISCFRQIPVEKLKNQTADVTRNSVQKSVCVLSTVPLYGHVQVKMSLITHAYFEEGDFSKVSLLEDTYHHLNACLSQIEDLANAPQLFVGLSARELILKFRHKALLLFKLLLLERKCVFYCSPVKPLCSTILTLLSLYPSMIETGLVKSTSIRPSRPLSPIPTYADTPDDEEEFEPGPSVDTPTSTEPNAKYSNVDLAEEATTLAQHDSVDSTHTAPPRSSQSQDSIETDNSDRFTIKETPTEDFVPSFADDGRSSTGGSACLSRDVSMDTIANVVSNLEAHIGTVAAMDSALCGLPLKIFDSGYLCLPYVSLPYMELLTDPNVRGYVVGATNVLFKQKKNIAEVLIEVDTGKIETNNLDLKKCLYLSTEDLRFADYIVCHVVDERHDVFLDDVGWEGGDEWIRTQFRIYLMSLLRTSLLPEGSRELDHFNSAFLSVWKDTYNYKTWRCSNHEEIYQLNPGHVFSGQLSVTDMKLRLTHTMQNTEGGRKLNQAMVNTTKALGTTSKAVGGAIAQAKGAVTTWWTSLTAVQANGGFEESDETEENPGQSCETGTNETEGEGGRDSGETPVQDENSPAVPSLPPSRMETQHPLPPTGENFAKVEHV
uniref:Late secretory pathway protein AVL9 homolog n=1 Tax=Cacopsylla melanoneura TaxID=428564 RepID=A0A8D8Q2P0_9HEMI